MDGGVMVIGRMHWVHSHRDNGIPRQKEDFNIECDEVFDGEYMMKNNMENVIKNVMKNNTENVM